jgi:dTDP-glucose 4,6-dehydratase
LSYAGNLDNTQDYESLENYNFIKGDISDAAFVNQMFEKFRFQKVIHLAAESHVDKSIAKPLSFLKSNVMGTVNLLNASKVLWDKVGGDHLFYQISTDEVYGSLDKHGCFTESSPYAPNSPYSASKASADHFVRAYGETYGLPYIISNCANNYGPNQHTEKLIPLTINSILNKQSIPVYGDGNYYRDWLYVMDHVAAIDLVFHKAPLKSTYNIGATNEWKNIDVVKLLCKITDQKLGHPKGTSENLISFVEDRPGHDLRYAIDASKIKKELGWEPIVPFNEGLSKTVEWYIHNLKSISQPQESEATNSSKHNPNYK